MVKDTAHRNRRLVARPQTITNSPFVNPYRLLLLSGQRWKCCMRFCTSALAALAAVGGTCGRGGSRSAARLLRFPQPPGFMALATSLSSR